MIDISHKVLQDIKEKGTTKRLKIKTLLKLYGYKKRSEENTTNITESLSDIGVQINPSLMRLGNHWEQTTEDWLYLSIKTDKPLLDIEITNKYPLPENWNEDLWFDTIIDKNFRTEK